MKKKLIQLDPAVQRYVLIACKGEETETICESYGKEVDQNELANMMACGLISAANMLRTDEESTMDAYLNMLDFLLGNGVDRWGQEFKDAVELRRINVKPDVPVPAGPIDADD